MRGIILAGGTGSRLRPLTTITSKQLLPVYDKPLIYYPLSVLMLAGIRETMVICTPDHEQAFRALLGNGEHLGIELQYATQAAPRGLADALLIGREFIGDEQICLILGDNIFYGHDFGFTLRQEVEKLDGCTLFGYTVADPERYGVAVLNESHHLVALEEKPSAPRGNLAVTGLYLYDNEALDYATELRPSARGELEITDLNRRFLDAGRARLVDLGRGTAWLDTGTADSLLEAGQFVQVLQKRQGVQIACLEEVAYRMRFISGDDLGALAARIGGPASEQGRYLTRVLETS
ncbi:glucose-1-phosphate thymidylyltransferase RfbA [Couchioplanes caeruleus]|uniref:glucose-1-phosphate thymidylyltransferase RfbA n=1 Tax=Couchioplanes caeruleus TaxID=56438 RepID=UPI00201C83F1|nr:glucose-1-phosphate thymidylyltransferase RfbA [Couchioplanes caeruleus]UQU67657.1 glucose-1-phosphate thymidylyltransferase RfbA [Couchioplanes caeruleus]